MIMQLIPHTFYMTAKPNVMQVYKSLKYHPLYYYHFGMACVSDISVWKLFPKPIVLYC